MIQGGAGGSTGNLGGAIAAGTGGGGAGVVLRSDATATLTNMGTILGGTGSTGGVGVDVEADGSTVINGGSISGDGSANAVTLAGQGDRLELRSGYQFTGTLAATGANATLALGGDAATGSTPSFNLADLDDLTKYSGFANLDKSGSSTWTLTGTTTSFTGPMTVSGGTLLVNGDARTFSMMTVNTGATLGGSGTIGSTTVNGGTFAPGTGDANGLLTVNGSLTFTAASTYLVQVSPSSASQVNVTGAATLAGAGVKAVFASGSYVNKQYTILTATGGVNGTFSGPVNTNLPANFTSALNYDGNNAYLDITLGMSSPSGSGGSVQLLNRNQQNVANVIENFFNANGGIPLALGGLTPQGLTQASGETATGAQQTTFDAMNLFMGLMSDPTEHGTTPAPSSAPSSPAQAYAEMPTKAFPRFQPAFTPGWSTWASSFGGSQTTDGNSATGSNSVTSRIFGGAAGADYHLAPDTLLGFALMGGGTNFSVANGGTGRSDLFQASAFARQNFGAGYVSAALAYGWQDITTDRYVGGSHQHAEFDANTYSGRIEGGYRFALPNLGGVGITPYAAAQVTVFDLPAYAEQAIGGGVFALNYASEDVTDTRSELGFRTDKSFVVGDAILTLRGRAAWAHDFDTDRSVSATFQSLPGASFVVNGAALAPDSALVSASAETKWANGWSVAATFDGEFSDVTASYAAKGVVRYAW
jgi:autotransporter-associated beta strand protein